MDEKPAKLLRANFIMRGVQVPAGNHTIEFRFEPPVKGLYVTLSGIGLGILLCGFLAVSRLKGNEEKTNGKPAVPAQQRK